MNYRRKELTMKVVSEVQIMPVKPNKGLVGFASFVLYEAVFCGSVGIYTKPMGGYRLVYPTRKVFGKDIDIFHPSLDRKSVV